MNKADKQHIARVVALGCVVCRNLGFPDSPAEAHHCKGSEFNSGYGLKSSNRDVVGLCGTHHRLGANGVAYHAGPESFERNFGTQHALLDQVNELLEG